jgi:putative endonuclease
MSNKRKRIGTWGEQFAVKEFEKIGFSVVAKNWQKKFGELDLIFVKDKEIVFVEVKTRSSNLFGWAEEAVGQSKKKKIKQTIDQFLLENIEFQDCFPRFDIMAIEISTLLPNIIHYENVEL